MRQFAYFVERLVSVTEIDVSGINSLVPQLSTNAEPLTLEGLRRLINDPSNTVFVARERLTHKIVGTSTLHVSQQLHGAKGWLEDLIVDEHHRRRGLGRILSIAVIREAQALGLKKLDLMSAPEREDAHDLYYKLGWTDRDPRVMRLDPANFDFGQSAADVARLEAERR